MQDHQQIRPIIKPTSEAAIAPSYCFSGQFRKAGSKETLVRAVAGSCSWYTNHVVAAPRGQQQLGHQPYVA